MKDDTGLGLAAASVPPEASGVMVGVVGVEGKIEFIHTNVALVGGWGGEELDFSI